MSDNTVPPDPARPKNASPKSSSTTAQVISKERSMEVTSFLGPGGEIGETTFVAGREPSSMYAVWRPGVSTCAYVNKYRVSKQTIYVPPTDKRELMKKRVVLLPSVAAEYGSQRQLVAEMIAFVHRYADVPPFWEELIAHYVLMTWVYDRFSAVPYLRFLGEPQSGKTRCLQVAAHLCYKATMAGGATTVSPMFRLLEFWGGTFVIDEADYQHSDLSAEIVKILNSGYMRDLPVLRSEKSGDNYEPRAFDVFGPKIFTTRREFDDLALESRCLTLRTPDRRIRPDIPRQLPPLFNDEALALRNKLLRWRFDNRFRIQCDESQLLALHPRLTQIGAPLYAVSDDDSFRTRLLTFLSEQADEQHGDRPQVIVAEAIRRLLADEQKWPATLPIKEVCWKAREVGEEWETATNFSPRRTGTLVRSLGFAPRRTNIGYQFAATKTGVSDLLTRYPPPSACVDET